MIVSRAVTAAPRIAVVAAALATVAFAVIVGGNFGGDSISGVIDDVGNVAASMVAAIACAVAARASTGRLRVAWALLSSSAAAWCLGELIRTTHETITGAELAHPSRPEVAVLAALLAVVGVLTFPAAPGAPPRSWRYWLDGAVIATAFFFVSWALGLGTIVNSLKGGFLPAAASLASPIGDIVLTTVLILAIGRAGYQQRDRMLVLLAGIAAITVADFGFHVSILDTGWFGGYLLIAIAAGSPANQVQAGAGVPPIDVRQLVLPWFVVLLAGITTVMLALSGQELDPILTVLAGILFVLLMLSQVAAHRESLALLVKSMRAEATLGQVIARAPVGIARISSDMTVADANPRFAALLNRDPVARTSIHMTEFMPAAEVDRMSAKLRTLSSDSDSAEGETEGKRQDGTSTWLRWSAARGGEGDARYIAMFEDITTARAAAEAAAANLAALEHMNQLKTEFLATFRHEFKTALVGIEGFGELMSTGEVSPDEVKSYASEILNDARRLDRMISELMDLDQVERGRAAIALAPLDLNTLVEDVVTAMRNEGVRNAIMTDLDPATPAVSGDRALLQNLLRTLIGNAVQYSPRSGRIVVSTTKVPGFAQTVVKDQGLAARGEFQDRMFNGSDLYAGSPMRKVVGTELGLAMARRVVEMHGGRIWVRRVEDGAGSEVNFTIPERVAVPTPSQPAGA